MSTPCDKEPAQRRGAYGGVQTAVPPANVAALAATDLKVAYPDRQDLALRGLSLRVNQGGCIALVGPNGAGKSTFLKALAGVLPVRSGKLEVFGQAPGSQPAWVAYLEQRAELDWRFPISVERLVLSGAYGRTGWFRRPVAAERDRAREALDQMGLYALRHRRVGELSGGQQQRTLFARTLVQNASLLLLDEPLNAVDAQTRQVVERCLQRLRAEGRTVVMATHDLGRTEGAFDHAAYLVDGRRVDSPPGAPDPCHDPVHTSTVSALSAPR